MSYPTQAGVQRRLEAETRKAGREYEDAHKSQMLHLWATAKREMQAAIMTEYRLAHGKDEWTLAAAGPTLERIGRACMSVLYGFYYAASGLTEKSIRDSYRLESLRQVWMLDMLTPPSSNPKLPAKILREAVRPGDDAVTWDQALAEWLRAYSQNLSTNLRLEALHSGSITDAADEVDAAKVDGFDPAYKFSSMLSGQILQSQRDARADVADENEDMVAEEIFQTLEDGAVCPDCDSQDGKRLEDVEMLPHVYGFNCRCFERIVPRNFAELLRNGTDAEKDAALDWEARGLVPDAMAIKDPNSALLPVDQTLKAHIIVDFGQWVKDNGLNISGRAE